MTTNENRPRGLGELLEEYETAGYSGMTDEEIEAIMEYRITRAKQDSEHEARIKAIIEHERARTELAEQAYKDAVRSLEETRAQPLQLIVLKEVKEQYEQS